MKKSKKNIYSLLLIFNLSLIFLLINCNPSPDVYSGKVCGDAIHLVQNGEFCHGTSYRFPTGNCDEAQCHGSSFTGGNTGGPSCFKCHADPFLFERTHTVPMEFGSAWHHKNVSNDNFTVDCTGSTCHGTPLGSTPRKGPSCAKCHGSIP